MPYKKHEGASADNYHPKTANREKVIVNILRSDIDRNQVRVHTHASKLLSFPLFHSDGQTDQQTDGWTDAQSPS